MIYIGVLLGILGAFLAAINRANHANVVWSVSSILLAYRAYNLGDQSSVLLFSVYEIIALYGVIRYVLNSRKSKVYTVECRDNKL